MIVCSYSYITVHMSILGCGVLQGLGAWDAAIKCSVLANISRQYVDHLAVYIYIYIYYCTDCFPILYIYIYICYTYIDTKVILPCRLGVSEVSPKFLARWVGQSCLPTCWTPMVFLGRNSLKSPYGWSTCSRWTWKNMAIYGELFGCLQFFGKPISCRQWLSLEYLHVFEHLRNSAKSNHYFTFIY